MYNAVSIQLSDPQFQGQTKDKLSSPEAAKLEGIVRDHFEICCRTTLPG